MDLLERPEWRLAVALAIGLMIGAERERRKGDGPSRNPTGIRTFALVALLGGLAEQAGGNALVVLAGAFVAAATLAGYVLGDRNDPGLTTEVAFMLTYVLGVFSQHQPELALAVGVSGTALLAARSRLHHTIKNVLTDQELLDALIFAVMAAVVLPLVPDRTVDPLGVLNPFSLWRLMVVITAITGAGYMAQRLLGPRYGLALSGLAGGFISSTATIAAMGARAKADAHLLAPSVAGATASTVATFVQLAILVATVNPPLIASLVWPLALGGGAALVYTGIWVLRSTRDAVALPSVSGRAFDLRMVALFSLLVGGVTILSTLLERWLGATGVLLAAGTAGLADAHASAASVAAVAAAGKLDTSSAVLGVLLAFSSNTLSKMVFAASSGSKAFARRIQLGLIWVLLGVWVGFVIFTQS